MSDSFGREREADEQDQAPVGKPEDDDNEEPLEYPERLPMEAPEADVLEQTQTVDFDEEAER